MADGLADLDRPRSPASPGWMDVGGAQPDGYDNGTDTEWTLVGDL